MHFMRKRVTRAGLYDVPMPDLRDRDRTVLELQGAKRRVHLPEMRVPRTITGGHEHGGSHCTDPFDAWWHCHR